MSRKKLSRSEQARINGARSRGPKTAEGRRRIVEARRKHGIFAVNNTILSIDSPEAYEALRNAVIAHWAPRNAYELCLVDEIVACNWLISRLRLCITHATNTAITRIRQEIPGPISWQEAATRAELEVNGPDGAATKLNRRLRAAVRERTAHIAQLKIAKEVFLGQKSQEVLDLNDLRPGTFHSEPPCDPSQPEECAPEPTGNPEEPK